MTNTTVLIESLETPGHLLSYVLEHDGSRDALEMITLIAKPSDIELGEEMGFWTVK